METNTPTCQNCEKPYEEGFEFCPHCGQKTNEDLTIGVLFYNTISNYFSFDARFLKSFIPLMFRPGYLARKFLEGKRLLFLHPAQMYLFVSVIFFFILSLICFLTYAQPPRGGQGGRQGNRPEQREKPDATKILAMLDTNDDDKIDKDEMAQNVAAWVVVVAMAANTEHDFGFGLSDE